MTSFTVEVKILPYQSKTYRVLGKNSEQESMVVHCAVNEFEADRVADALNKALLFTVGK